MKNANTITILDLEHSFDLNLTSIQQITLFYVELREINLGQTNIGIDSLEFFVKNCSKKLIGLGVNDLPFNNAMLKTLVNRCSALRHLDLEVNSLYIYS